MLRIAVYPYIAVPCKWQLPILYYSLKDLSIAFYEHHEILLADCIEIERGIYLLSIRFDYHIAGQEIIRHASADYRCL